MKAKGKRANMPTLFGIKVCDIGENRSITLARSTQRFETAATLTLTHTHMPNNYLLEGCWVGGRHGSFQISSLAELCGWKSMSGV